MSGTHPAAKARGAAAALGRLLLEAGVLGESVSDEEGGDLALRIRLSEGAEPFRLRAHLAYCSSGRSKGRKAVSVRLDREQLWRWAGHVDPMLLCVHDADTGHLFLLDVKRTWPLWELARDDRATRSVAPSDGDRATPESARRLVWQARLQYYSMLLALQENAVHFAPEPQRDGRDAVAVALAFLKDVGIVAGEGVDAAFADAVRHSARHLSANYPDLSLRHAVMLSLIERVQDGGDCGVPRNLLESGTDVAGHLLRTGHPADWDALAALFARDAAPAGVPPAEPPGNAEEPCLSEGAPPLAPDRPQAGHG